MLMAYSLMLIAYSSINNTLHFFLIAFCFGASAQCRSAFYYNKKRMILSQLVTKRLSGGPS